MKARRLAAAAGGGPVRWPTAEVVGLRAFSRLMAAAELTAAGYIHHHLGQLQRAIHCYGKAFGLYRGLSDRYCEADTLSRIGDSQLSAGNSQAAHHAWTLAEDILRELGHPDADQTLAKLDLLAAGGRPKPKPTPNAAPDARPLTGSVKVTDPCARGWMLER